jgi:hypothetical protein
MGIAVVGGMVVGSLLTLFVIPAVYVLVTGRTAPDATRVAAHGEDAVTPTSVAAR